MSTSAAIRLDASEQWRGLAAPVGRIPRTMAPIVLASFAGHLLVVAAAVLTSRPPPAPPPEISVEIVHEVPKPPQAKAPQAKAPPAKAPEPQTAAAKPPEVKPAETGAEPARHAEVAPKTAVRPERKAEARPKPQPRVAAAPAAPEVDAEERKLAALQKELASLQAEQASLRAERTAAEAARAPAPVRETGLGPLPSSFQAVALPTAADGQGEAVSYQEIVFSALAKAKGFGRTAGLPGSAGVRFSLDATGRLVEVELVHKSGVPSLDAQALDIVRRAAPFPPPPQGAQRTFFANVNFVSEGSR